MVYSYFGDELEYFYSHFILQHITLNSRHFTAFLPSIFKEMRRNNIGSKGLIGGEWWPQDKNPAMATHVVGEL